MQRRKAGGHSSPPYGGRGILPVIRMNKKVFWILLALFLAVCAGESLLALKMAQKAKEAREEAAMFQD